MRSLLSCLTPALVASFCDLTSKMIMGNLPFTIKDHKKFLLNFLLTIGNRCVRKFRWYYGAMVIVTDRFKVNRNCCGWAVFATTILASYEALPVSPLVCILLCSSPPFPMLA